MFLVDMKLLSKARACSQARGSLPGDFVTKETGNLFNHIPRDQVLEHVNRSSKVAEGLVGFTRTDSASQIAGV